MSVLFSDNFPDLLESESNAEKLEQLQQEIAQWQQNWESYRQLGVKRGYV